MNINLEKIFFAYISKNKNYYEKVQPFYFKNADIKFTYTVVRDHMMINPSKDVPHPKQIVEMVLLEDKDKTLSKDMLKQILKTELTDLDEETFIKPKLKTWISINRMEAMTTEVIEEARALKTVTELDDTILVADRIKEIVDQATNTSFDDDDDLGTDFDVAEEHAQDHSAIKIRTGWNSLDTMLGGGWDRSTLNLVMGETSVGKSLWLQNIAVNAANNGHNVLFITLEMSVKKVLKRLGSMRLKIPINDYDQLSTDTEYMKEKINKLHKNGGGGDNGGDLFDNKLGKIITKFYAAGTTDVESFDRLIKEIFNKKGIKIDLLVVDYLTLMAPPKGLESNLYLKGKHIAEALRAIAAKFEIPVITAMQVAKDAWNTTDITLQSIPESKAIAETADTFFAIIRSEEMKRQNIYRLKLLKQRDGDFSRSQAKFDLNTDFLTIENDIFIDAF